MPRTALLYCFVLLQFGYIQLYHRRPGYRSLYVVWQLKTSGQAVPECGCSNLDRPRASSEAISRLCISFKGTSAFKVTFQCLDMCQQTAFAPNTCKRCMTALIDVLCTLEFRNQKIHIAACALDSLRRLSFGVAAEPSPLSKTSLQLSG